MTLRMREKASDVGFFLPRDAYATQYAQRINSGAVSVFLTVHLRPSVFYMPVGYQNR